MRKIIIILVLLQILSIGGIAIAALTDNGDGTVTDTNTGLMWQKATAIGTYTWQNALSYCENLTLARYTDWRLPNRNELQSLIDYSKSSPTIDTLLAIDTVSSYYWSSTTYAYNTNNAWYANFSNAYVSQYIKTNDFYVRAVRAGQPGIFASLAIEKTGPGIVISSPSGINCGAECRHDFTIRTDITLTATPQTGTTFTNWSGNGGCTGKMMTCRVTMDNDKTITATFAFANMINIKGDLEQSGSVNLTDAIIALRIQSNINPVVTIYEEASVSKKKICIEDAIYILQIVAGLRTDPDIPTTIILAVDPNVILNDDADSSIVTAKIIPFDQLNGVIPPPTAAFTIFSPQRGQTPAGMSSMTISSPRTQKSCLIRLSSINASQISYLP